MSNDVKELVSILIKNYKDKSPVIDLNKIPIGISGRHIHLCQKDLDALFGKDYKLTPIKDLSQPGQFACKEQLMLAGPKGFIEKVRIIGPARKATQVEILRSDAFKLGVKPVVRLSGDLDDTPGITIIGPNGAVKIEQGVIVSQRHIHFSPSQAKERGLKNGDIVSIRLSGMRGGILENVAIRAGEESYLDCHIDQEEANAFGITSKDYAEIIR
ncbi:phosphate propanoyltransferase [uncultured Anaerococcus sp.]|uniref:phosphate propanoyltransferase n=1 Tax=uncultured Anaerococcus sp. TaxID=293428 RepID=UPI00288B8F2B|nr:phosphate propanoyltransferase [uncultured Anaerococcus sp.]